MMVAALLGAIIAQRLKQPLVHLEIPVIFTSVFFHCFE